MKKFAAFLLIFLMVVSLVACAGNSETAETEPVSETGTEAEGKKVLVAYFSATNTTEGVAEHIANDLDADLYR